MIWTQERYARAELERAKAVQAFKAAAKPQSNKANTNTNKSNTESNTSFDKKAYQRELMRRRRAAKKGSSVA